MGHELNAHQLYLIEEFAEDYHARRLARRDLLRRTLLITGSIPVTASVLASLGCGGGGDEDDATPGVSPTAAATGAGGSPTAAATASATASAAGTATAGVDGRDVSFPGPGSDLKGYLARPAAAGPYPGILVIHENRGLLEHFKDVARRYAGQGFVAMAVDLLSRQGGTAGDPNQSAGALGAAKVEDLVADLQAYVGYLEQQPGVRAGGVGVTGFCFGGNYTWEIATASEEVAAAVPFYGRVRAVDDLPKTRAAVLAIYGALDTRITSQAEEVRAKLTGAGKTVEVKVYEGADHAFFNDTGGRYNAAAAEDAFAQAVAWFRKHLPQA